MARRTRSALDSAGNLNEYAWQIQVITVARMYHWRVYHPPDNRPLKNTGARQPVAAGFPDLTLVRGPELLFVELKKDNGRVAPAQQEWLDALAEVGDAVHHFAGAAVGLAGFPIPAVETHIWRPRDFDTLVEPRLSRGIQ